MGSCTTLIEKSWEGNRLYTNLTKTGKKWLRKSKNRESRRKKNMHLWWKNRPRNSSKCSFRTQTLTAPVQAQVKKILWAALAQKHPKTSSCKRLSSSWKTWPILSVRKKLGILLVKWERSLTKISKKLFLKKESWRGPMADHWSITLQTCLVVGKWVREISWFKA